MCYRPKGVIRHPQICLPNIQIDDDDGVQVPDVQSGPNQTQDTFDYGPQEIGMSQLQDAPSTQQTQPRAQRQRRPKKRYTPGTDALGKGKTRSSKQ